MNGEATTEQRVQWLAQRLEALTGELQQSRTENQVLRADLTRLQQGEQNAYQGVTQAIAASMQTFGQGFIQTLNEDRQQLISSMKASAKEHIQLVDTRGLGKPEKFKGKEEDFLPWKTRFTNFVASIFPDMRRALEHAEDCPEALDGETLKTLFEDPDDSDYIADLSVKQDQVYSALQQLCEQEAYDIVHNCEQGHGLEAWRKLNKRFDPTTATRKQALLKHILNQPRSSWDDLSAQIEKWMDLIKTYERRKAPNGNRCKVQEEVKLSVLHDMVPKDLEKHMLLNAKDFATFEQAMAAVSDYLEVKIGIRLTKKASTQENPKGKDDMDIGAFGKHGKGGKGSWNLGKGKGGKGRFGGGKAPMGAGKGESSKASSSKACHNCGKTGHFARDCKKQNVEGTCHNCGKPGHYARDCWSKTGSAKTTDKSQNSTQTSGKTSKGKGKDKSKKPNKGKKGLASIDENGNEVEPEEELGMLWHESSDDEGYQLGMFESEPPDGEPEEGQRPASTVSVGARPTASTLSQPASSSGRGPPTRSDEQRKDTLREEIKALIRSEEAAESQEELDQITRRIAEIEDELVSLSTDISGATRITGRTRQSMFMKSSSKAMILNEFRTGANEEEREMKRRGATEEELEQVRERRRELDAAVREARQAQREQPARLEDAMRDRSDQSEHDVRYHASIAAGVPHHQAWKREKKRRRAQETVRDQMKESREKLAEADRRWHERYDQPDSATAADYQPTADGLGSINDMEGEVLVGDAVTSFGGDETSFRVYSGKLQPAAAGSSGDRPEDRDELRINPNRLIEVRPPSREQQRAWSNMFREERRQEKDYMARSKSKPEDKSRKVLSPESKQQTNQARIERRQSTQMCPAFRRNQCKLGSACTFSHEEEAKPVPCHKYMAGKCKYGKYCWFTHDSEAKKDREARDKQRSEKEKRLESCPWRAPTSDTGAASSWEQPQEGTDPPWRPSNEEPPPPWKDDDPGDLCRIEKADWYDQHYWDRTEKIRMTFDTGAAVTAFGRDVTDGRKKTQANGAWYRTASGEECPDSGGIVLAGADEHANKRRIPGRVTDVRKPLVSGNEVIKGSDVFLYDGRGYIMPKNLEATEKIREFIMKVIKECGDEDFTPLYTHRGIFCFDYWARKPKDLGAVDADVDETSGNGC